MISFRLQNYNKNFKYASLCKKKCKFSSFYLKISNIFCTFAVAKVLIQKYETVTNCNALKLQVRVGGDWVRIVQKRIVIVW